MSQPLTMQWGTVRTPESERIPIHVIAELIESWIAKYNAEHPEASDKSHSNRYCSFTSGDGPLSILAFHSGVSGRKLRMIRALQWETGDRGRGTCKVVDWVPFDIADKIVSATDGSWYVEPLSQFYGPLPVRSYERKYEEAAA